LQNIIVFGVGQMGRLIIPHLKEKHHILFLADNDSTQWGKLFEGYSIKSPNEIVAYDCNVVITSKKYGSEIAMQLQHIGVHRKRLCFCRGYRATSIYTYEVYPLLVEEMSCTNIPLVQYDILHNVECETTHIKVMVFCSFFSVYTKQLIENMAKRYQDIEFSLLTAAKECKEKIATDKLKHIYCFESMTDLKTILEQLPLYNAMQLLWIEQEWAYFYQLIRKKTKHLNLNIGGSDFYRANTEERNFKKKLIQCADKVTAETTGIIQDVEMYYKDVVHNKIGLLPFGIEVLDFMHFVKQEDQYRFKKDHHISQNKLVVTCGHNAAKEHQHMAIIDALCALPKEIKEKITCVFPMTYPSGMDTYIDEVHSRMQGTDIDYVILTDFMDFQEMAEYAMISDIMIHVQTTDQLSSTMLEELYAESIVIAGSWLPYQSLHEKGIYFLDVNTIPDSTDIMKDVVTHVEAYRDKCKGNKKIVWEHSSWDELAPKWHALWI
jgi:hypothetical protein